jgi:hypothetical protein
MKKILLTAFVALIYSAAIAQSAPAASTVSPKSVESECDKLKNRMDSTNRLITQLRIELGSAPNPKIKLKWKSKLDVTQIQLSEMQRRCMVLKCNYCSKPTTKAQ